MATLAPQGRITTDVVEKEINRLRAAWSGAGDRANDYAAIIDAALGKGATAALDRFDAVQLAEVLQISAQHPSAASAGRELFAQSRLEKKSSNDADRLVKYLARFGLKFEDIPSAGILGGRIATL